MGIFDYLHDALHVRYPKAALNDDGRGEIADIITLSRTQNDRVIVRFYHCKGARGAGANLDDLYVLLGQARARRAGRSRRSFAGSTTAV